MAFGPTLALPPGRPLGFSWQEFSPLCWSFAKCEERRRSNEGEKQRKRMNERQEERVEVRRVDTEAREQEKPQQR